MRHLRYIPLLAFIIAMGTESIAWTGQRANTRDLREQRPRIKDPSILLENTDSANSLAFGLPLASDQILSILAARVLVGLINSQLPTILANPSQSDNTTAGYPTIRNDTRNDISSTRMNMGSPGGTYPMKLLSEANLGITTTITIDSAKAIENAPSSFSPDRTPQETEAMVGHVLMALRTLGAAMLL
ncbi:hypothetical protein BDV24DRAFT_157825 [Aspergillus arachidicola]|uniref:Uncharacterized protein n=1 Tax=Aspergillus arachidicola TaxID=656916 RepID=A0A2G7FIS1_9EURO|nr:hypothetical protein BDV24DRAFT_157825 [Aspergillus arachidicola]PIG80508.1 hypothetical protein AARAC_001639 [Aspergillus arachidicola]